MESASPNAHPNRAGHDLDNRTTMDWDRTIRSRSASQVSQIGSIFTSEASPSRAAELSASEFHAFASAMRSANTGASEADATPQREVYWRDNASGVSDSPVRQPNAAAAELHGYATALTHTLQAGGTPSPSPVRVVVAVPSCDDGPPARCDERVPLLGKGAAGHTQGGSDVGALAQGRSVNDLDAIGVDLPVVPPTPRALWVRVGLVALRVVCGIINTILCIAIVLFIISRFVHFRAD